MGLIAGSGRFPFLVQEQAREHGIEVLTLGIEDEADPSLESAGGSFHWVGLGQLSKAVRFFRQAGVSRAIMAGRVRHKSAFRILRPDHLLLKVLSRLRSKQTDALLKTVADVLGEEGIELLDSTLLLGKYLAEDGVLSKRGPGRTERPDVAFGLHKARELARLDIGQTVVVKDQTVIAVEAMEGTDRTIQRAGKLVSGRLVVAKVARPSQDMRFDVPVVGLGTITSMVEAGATVLGLERGRVLLLERDALIREADQNDIAIVGADVDEEAL